MIAKKLLVEGIGAFFLMLIIILSVLGAGNLAPIPIGIGLAVLVYMGGHISGAHYNPAVTVGVLVRGKITTNEAVGYIAAQIIGALLACLAASQIRDISSLGLGNFTTAGIIGGEFLFTFLLVYVVLNVATAKSTANNQFYGFAIGGTVLTGAYAVGGVSGAAFNPAVAIGGCVIHALNCSNILLYLVAELVAGALAAVVFKYINSENL